MKASPAFMIFREWPQIPRISAAVRSLPESPQRHPGGSSRRQRKVATAGVHDIARVFLSRRGFRIVSDAEI